MVNDKIFKVQINDVGLLQAFLSVAEIDFIDVLLSKEYISLFVNQAELFSSLTLKSSTTSDDADIRIPKVILAKLLREGFLEIHVNEDDVKVVMQNSNGSAYCTASFIRQGFLKTDYRSKLDIVAKAMQNNSVVKLEEFDGLEKIMKITRSTLNVGNGVAMVATQNGRVYKKVNPSYKFAITPFAYTVLKRCSDAIFDIDNNLVAKRDGFIIVITKCKGFDNSEYSMFVKEKAAVVCDIDLTDLKYFTYRMNIDCPSIILNLYERNSKFVSNRIEYEIPIHITNLKIAGNNIINEVKLPETIMKEVLYSIDVSYLTLAKKRTFTQIRCDKFLIVF